MMKLCVSVLVVVAGSLGSGCVPAGLDLTTTETKFLNMVSPQISVKDIGKHGYRDSTGTGIVVRNNVEHGTNGKRVHVSYILTARHVVVEDGYSIDRVFVKIPNYFFARKVGYETRPARVIAISKSKDLALLAVESDVHPFAPKITELYCARMSPESNVYSCRSFGTGLGALSVGKYLPGSITIRKKFLRFQSSTFATFGASGGGFFARDKRGRLHCVGVITNRIDGIGSAGYPASEIKEFLEASIAD
jgi:hypothetical protein